MDRLTDLFKILSDETRLRIMVLIAREELCVCEICGVLELSQPKVSKHLAKIKDKGFAVDARDEQFIFYSLSLEDPVVVKIVTDILGNIENYPKLLKDSQRLADKDKYSGKHKKK